MVAICYLPRSYTGKLLRTSAFDRLEPQVLRAAVFRDEEDAAAVFRPSDFRRRAVEAFGECALARAVRVHQIKMRDVVRVVVLVVARVGDELAVGRDAWVVVRPLSVGQ